MKKTISKALLLTIGTLIAIIASASYALIIPTTKTVASTPIPAQDIVIPPTQTDKTPPIPTIAKPVPEQFEWAEYSIKSGDSLSLIFAKLKLSSMDMNKIIRANKLGKAFVSIVNGKTLRIKTDLDGNLLQLIYAKNAIESLVATRVENDFIVEKQDKEVEHRMASAQATIQNSLFLDAKKAGLSDKVIMQLVDIFAWDIDFALNIKNGDQITVLYEKLFVNDHEIGTGNIAAVEFENHGKTHTAIRYEDNAGKSNYYSPNGQKMQKAFLRTPVDFARISSHFNLKRRHPVLNRIRAHKGVDYAARTGTPVKSTASGKIIYRGWKGGYGRVVIVQHGKKYSTLYAHLSKFSKRLKTGSKVQQGQIIGYVGKSGLASGAHLHYELRVNGVHKNPLTVRLPNTTPIDQSLLADFKKQSQSLLSQLEKAKLIHVAKNDY